MGREKMEIGFFLKEFSPRFFVAPAHWFLLEQGQGTQQVSPGEGLRLLIRDILAERLNHREGERGSGSRMFLEVSLEIN